MLRVPANAHWLSDSLAQARAGAREAHTLDRGWARLVFTPRGWNDHLWWQANDRATLKRINRLVYVVDGEDLVVLQARYHHEAEHVER